MAGVEVSLYAHSPVHKAIATKDYASLKRILSSLPKFSDADEVRTEAQSLAEEEKADLIAAVVDRRDVPNRETPLHLAVKLGDVEATEMLMAAGADWSLQNEQGWSALQEAICTREEAIATTIIRNYQRLAWAKWCRRLPRLIATMSRMRDFYMEITFHFDSKVIPFIARIAPSDTYRIWKRGSNLRADMTLAGFDGFKIQRSDQTVLFLGEGSEDGRVPPGSLCVISHRNKEVINTLNGARTPATEAEIQQEVAAMSKTNIFRPGLDVTEAVLLPQLTSWRKHERTEMVGPWKTKVYDMHHVVVSVKSRRVPGATAEDEVQPSSNEEENHDDGDDHDFDDILTEEEKKQLEAALKMDASEIPDDGSETPDDLFLAHRHSSYELRELSNEDSNSSSNGNSQLHKKKRWLKPLGKKGSRYDGLKNAVPSRSSFSADEKVSDLLGESPSRCQAKPGRHSVSGDVPLTDKSTPEGGTRGKEVGLESEYRKGLRPVLWLCSSFPLQTEELLPMLDVLASKVKAIRRLRELLTTKLPPGTFPVKVAIPVVPTIRVLITFTKFEELLPPDEFCTPPSSPVHNHKRDGSWLQWMKVSHRHGSPKGGRLEDLQDPFQIPPEYKWTTAEEKRKKIKAMKKRQRKARS